MSKLDVRFQYFTRKGRSQAEKQRTAFCKARLFKARESNSAVSKKLLPFPDEHDLLLSHFPRTNKKPNHTIITKLHNARGRPHLSRRTPFPPLSNHHVSSSAACHRHPHYLSQAVLIATCTPPCIHMHVHTYIAIDRHDIIPKSSNPSILDLLHD